jgi:hypothetical protein
VCDHRLPYLLEVMPRDPASLPAECVRDLTPMRRERPDLYRPFARCVLAAHSRSAVAACMLRERVGPGRSHIGSST